MCLWGSMEAFDCLSSTTDIWGHYFLQASAGTGKTFTIEHIVIRALIQATPIDQILIVTFTRAATRELRLRIQKRIRLCIDQLQKKETDCPYLQTAIESHQTAKAIELLTQALQTFDAAQIYTIHAFCHKMLNLAGFEAGVTLDLKDPEDQAYVTFASSQVRDYLRTGLKPHRYSSGQIKRVYKSAGSNIVGLERALVRLAARKISASQFAPFEDHLKELNRALQLTHWGSQDEVCADLEALAKGYKGTHNRDCVLHSGMSEQIQIWSKCLSQKKISKEMLNQLLMYEDSFIEKLDSNNKKKKQQDPCNQSLIDQIENKLLPLMKQIACPKILLESMALDCQKRIECAQDTFDIQFPDTLLKRMEIALEKDAFYKKIRSQFKMAIIDEFQDTDSVQWTIFRNLFLKEKDPIEAFYLVGDPKQSIYAFRQADLYTYLEAAQILKEQNQMSLSTNYRSTPKLVAGLNAFFGHPNATGWLNLPKAGDSLKYQRVNAGTNEPEIQDSKRPVHLWLLDVKPGRSTPSKQIEESVLFPSIAKEIQNINLPLSAFAILVKDRYQAMRLQSYLRKLRIATSSKSNFSVCGSKAYVVLDALLQAMINPRQLSAVKKLLSAPLITWSYSSLCRSKMSEVMQKVIEQLFEWRSLAQSRGIGCVMEQAMHYNFGHDKTLLELLSFDRQNIIDWMHLVELLLERSTRTKSSIGELHKYLKQLKMENPDHVPSLKQRESHQKDAVTIMTTHMSKGLEFDVVFALGVASRNTVDSHLAEEELKELDAEKMRLLYVAMTRAKKRIYLPVVLPKVKPPALGAGSAAELFFARWELDENCAHAIAGALNKEKDISTEILEEEIFCQAMAKPKKDLLQSARQHHLAFRSHVISSYSSLVKDTQVPIVGKEGLDLITQSLHSMPAGAKTGIILHDLLEKVLLQNLHVKPEKIVEYVHKKLTDTDLMPWSDCIASGFIDLMKVDLGGFCLQEIGQMSTEMEFLFPVEEALAIRGFCDLIFQHRGKVYILDWKTNFLGIDSAAYERENLIHAMQSHDYFLQARIYSAAVIKWWRLYDSRAPKDFFGGAYYVFLRGLKNNNTHGIYHFQPLGEDHE